MILFQVIFNLFFSYWTTFKDVLLKVCTRIGMERRCTLVLFFGKKTIIWVRWEIFGTTVWRLGG